ncbi:DBF zinc finger domain protein [Spraguea lophii 42_110]|uniref:DBF zinc finger domain protein n=1 Tax=Spraguea lophii (strain 42_110) TaxID=1358809 RepID=S7W8Y6_SPRLO|nr:DBF zinc finger domain protein [Spraguea lophii 42_110]
MKRYQVFTKPYLLVEDINNRFQPFYKEYEESKLIKINFQSLPLCCPFTNNKKVRSSKKRKGPKQGFCEVCYIKFTDYDEHIQENEHREYARDNSNYRDVDAIIHKYGNNNILENLYQPTSPLLKHSPSINSKEDSKESADTILLEEIKNDENIYCRNIDDFIDKEIK